jgi:hypothetical protein
MLSLRIGEDAVYLLRDRLEDVLSRLTGLSFPGGSLTFAERLAELAETAKETEATRVDSGTGEHTTSESAATQDISTFLSPRTLVRNGYRLVESEIKKVAREFGIIKNGRSSKVLVRILRNKGVIDDLIVENFHQLTTIRLQISHEPNLVISDQQAGEYFAYCHIFVEAINSAANAFRTQQKS